MYYNISLLIKNIIMIHILGTFAFKLSYYIYMLYSYMYIKMYRYMANFQ